MAAPRKKDNHRARMIEAARRILRMHRACIAHVPGLGAILLDYQTLREYRPSPGTMNAITEIKHPWLISVTACCVRDNEDYGKSESHVLKKHYYASELSDYLQEQLTELASRQNPAHLRRVCWIAFPYNYDPSEEQVRSILRSLGAWD